MHGIPGRLLDSAAQHLSADLSCHSMHSTLGWSKALRFMRICNCEAVMISSSIHKCCRLAQQLLTASM